MTVSPHDIDEAAIARLYAELPGKVEDALRRGAPLLHHLNGDTSWLFQIPLGDDPQGKKWYNVLIEPWLAGTYTVVSRFLFHSSHSIAPAFGSVDEVGDLCLEVDRLSGVVSGDGVNGFGTGLTTDADGEKAQEEAESPTDTETEAYARQRRIDAVMLCENEQDHVHEPTLRQLNPSIPVFGPPATMERVRAFKYFDTVYTTPLWSPATTNSPTAEAPKGKAEAEEVSPPPLGSGILAHHIGNGDGKAPHFEATVFLSFPSASGRASAARQGILYNPHGPSPSSVLPSTSPQLDILAYLANTLDHTTGGMVTNHGGMEVAGAIIRTGAKYAVETHMEEQNMSGLVTWFNKRLGVVSFDEAKRRLSADTAAAAMEDAGADGEADANDEANGAGRLSREERAARLERASAVVLGVGQSFVLA